MTTNCVLVYSRANKLVKFLETIKIKFLRKSLISLKSGNTCDFESGLFPVLLGKFWGFKRVAL